MELHMLTEKSSAGTYLLRKCVLLATHRKSKRDHISGQNPKSRQSRRLQIHAGNSEIVGGNNGGNK
jgi:hypothetical protein